MTACIKSVSIRVTGSGALCWYVCGSGMDTKRPVGVLYSIWAVFGKRAFASQAMCGKSACHVGLGFVLKYSQALSQYWNSIVTIVLAACRCTEGKLDQICVVEYMGVCSMIPEDDISTPVP